MIGTQVGNYRIDEKIGEGGMGTVYRATELNLDRTVAIKVLNPTLALKPVILERFRAEAKAQANLNHPNIAILYAFLTEEANAMMVMEYVDGENFLQIVNRRGALPASEAVPLFKQVLAGVGAAHEMNIVHRDIKPANIMLNTRGVVKVMDFGIAKITGERGLTRTGAQLGTVYYMSPEQVKGKGADSRADIYALGVTFYELLTGHVPFDGASEFSVLTAHVNTMPPLLSLHTANIPKGIENIVLKALEKSPEDRFQTVAEFSEALDHPELWEEFVPRSVLKDDPCTAETLEIEVGGMAFDDRTKLFGAPSDSGKTLPPPVTVPTAKSFWTPITGAISALVAAAVLAVGGYSLFRPKQPPHSTAVAKPLLVVRPAPPEAAPDPVVEKAPVAAAKPAAKEPVHLVIPSKTVVQIRLKSAITGSTATEGQEFPVVLMNPLTVNARDVAPRDSEARIVLTRKSKKLQFQLTSLLISGSAYKVRSDTFEFNGSVQGKRAGKFGAIKNLVGGNKGDSNLELPKDTEMKFTIKSPIPITVR